MDAYPAGLPEAMIPISPPPPLRRLREDPSEADLIAGRASVLYLWWRPFAVRSQSDRSKVGDLLTSLGGGGTPEPGWVGARYTTPYSELDGYGTL